MLDLQPIKDRLAAATPDHWRWDRTVTALDANGDEEWLILSQDKYTPDAALVGTARTKENAALMAHSREDLTALVAEVERLENEAAVMQQVTLAGLAAEVERLREAIQTHREQCHRTNKVELARWDWDLWAVLDA